MQIDFVTIIAFILIIGLVIFCHELGHFLTAKARGVQVQEFGFGFPPRLFAIRRGGTEYSLNLFIFGGFVRLLGEEDPRHPKSLAGKGVGTRLLVLSAGSVMNALLPILLLTISFMVPKEVMVGQVVVNQVVPGSPAQRAGIEPGDRLLSINGRPVQNLSDVIYNVQLNLGREITVELEDGGGQRMTSLIPRWAPPEGEGPMGISLKLVGATATSRSYPFWKAVPMGGRTLYETMFLVKNEVMGWFIRGTPPQVAGPVGIFQITEEVASIGVAPLLQFTAFLSINLAIINLLPLPALDGGRIAFVLLEWVRRGKRISPQKERLVHLVGFALLMALILVVTYNDILRLISGESLVR